MASTSEGKKALLAEFRNSIQKKLGLKISERETQVIYEKYAGNIGMFV